MVIVKQTDLYKIHLPEGFHTLGTEDVEDGDDILVVKMPQEFNLPQRAQGEHGMVEGCNSLYGDLALRWKMGR